MTPNTPRFDSRALDDSKPKPKPLQWSLSQVLHTSESYGDNRYYGYDVDISGNNLLVMERGTGSAYLYERLNTAGQWSQQRKFIGTLTPNVNNHGAIEGSHVVISDGTKFLSYADNRNENCLIVSVEDHFGDGWNGTFLVVEAPDGQKDLFAPDCDTENPLQFRYCPFQNTDKGKYKFYVDSSAKEKSFYWEILWRVYDEYTGQWYVGNWDTRMEFDWDVTHKGFWRSKLSHNLPSNITCHSCPPKPTHKPTVSPTKRGEYSTKHPTSPPVQSPTPSSSTARRNLKGFHTSYPTLSPAPTFVQDPSRIWNYVYMSDDNRNAWFDAEHKGTSYYISDKSGKKLITVGTMCPFDGQDVFSGEVMCYQDLKDGEYVFRVGGALDRFKANRNWWFCGRLNNGGPQTQMTFRVSDEGQTCTILSHFTAKTYCRHVADYDVVLRFVVGLGLDTDSLPAGSYIDADDKLTIETAFRETFSSLDVDTITIVGASSSQLTVDIGFIPKKDVFTSPEVMDSELESLKSQVISAFSKKSAVFPHYFATNPRLSSPMHYVYTAWMESIEFADFSGMDTGEGGVEWQPESGSSDGSGGTDDVTFNQDIGEITSSSSASTMSGGSKSSVLVMLSSILGGVGVALLIAFAVYKKYRDSSISYESLPMDSSAVGKELTLIENDGNGGSNKSGKKRSSRSSKKNKGNCDMKKDGQRDNLPATGATPQDSTSATHSQQKKRTSRGRDIPENSASHAKNSKKFQASTMSALSSSSSSSDSDSFSDESEDDSC